jgi:hypothetical protein
MDKTNTPPLHNLLSNEISDFLDSLSEKEKKSYNIAKSFLGSSFDILKCNVFLEYQKNKKNLINEEKKY